VDVQFRTARGWCRLYHRADVTTPAAIRQERKITPEPCRKTGESANRYGCRFRAATAAALAGDLADDTGIFVENGECAFSKELATRHEPLFDCGSLSPD